jgi:hypothetical protein
MPSTSPQTLAALRKALAALSADEVTALSSVLPAEVLTEARATDNLAGSSGSSPDVVADAAARFQSQRDGAFNPLAPKKPGS